MRYDLKRLTVIFVLLLSLSGCSVSFMYRYAGFLVMWEVTDYISLTREQKKQLKADINLFAQWHLSSELPLYRSTLIRAEELIDNPSSENTTNTLDSLNTFWPRSIAHLLPMFMKYRTVFTDKQITEFIDNIEESSHENWSEITSRTDAEQLEHAIEHREAGLTTWFGDLSKTQVKFISEWEAKYVPDAHLRSQLSKLWLQKLRTLLMQRNTSATFERDLSQFIINFNQLKTPEHIAVTKINRRYFIQFVTEFIRTLTEKQRAHAHDKISDIIEEFDDAIKA